MLSIMFPVVGALISGLTASGSGGPGSECDGSDMLACRANLIQAIFNSSTLPSKAEPDWYACFDSESVFMICFS